MFLSLVIAFNIKTILLPFKWLLKTDHKMKIMKPQIVLSLSGILILISLGGCATGDPVYIEPVGWGYRPRPIFFYEQPGGPEFVRPELGPEFAPPPPPP